MNYPLYSPVQERDFVWIGMYPNGTSLSEFSFNTKKEHSFYELKKNELIKFGLIGHGLFPHFNTWNGVFYLEGNTYELEFRTEKELIPLTSALNTSYHDVITYKDAECFNGLDVKSNNKNLTSFIYQYVFGYKTQIKYSNINFYLRVLFKIPLNKPMCLSIRLVPDQNLKGILYIRRNGIIVLEADADFKKNEAAELEWRLR